MERALKTRLMKGWMAAGLAGHSGGSRKLLMKTQMEAGMGLSTETRMTRVEGGEDPGLT